MFRSQLSLGLMNVHGNAECQIIRFYLSGYDIVLFMFDLINYVLYIKKGDFILIFQGNVICLRNHSV